MKRIYGVECAKCKERLFSLSVHDLHYCRCGCTFIDGGREYFRTGFETGFPPRRIYWCKRDGEYPTAIRKDSFPY